MIGIDITPTTSLIRAMKNQNFTALRMIGELIDNSLDAGATRIEIIRTKDKEWIFRDDGTGIKDIMSVLRQGVHSSGADSIGMFGVGLKDAVIWGGDTLDISTSSASKIFRLYVDWLDIERSGRWLVSEPEAYDFTKENLSQLKIMADQGTTIIIGKARKTSKSIDAIAESIGYHYSGAIKRGVQISIKAGKKKPKIIVAWKGPEIEKIIEGREAVKGKSFTYRAGILKDGETIKRQGYIIHFMDRVICETIRGTGNYNLSRFFCEVRLDPSWRWSLGKNKDHLSDDTELCQELFRICEPLLREASEIASSYQIGSQSFKVNEALKQACIYLSNNISKKPKRKKNKASGAIGTIKNNDAKGANSNSRKNRKKKEAASINITHELADLGDEAYHISSSPERVNIQLNRNRIQYQSMSEEATVIHVFSLAALHLGIERTSCPLFKYQDVEAKDRSKVLIDDFLSVYYHEMRPSIKAGKAS